MIMNTHGWCISRSGICVGCHESCPVRARKSLQIKNEGEHT